VSQCAVVEGPRQTNATSVCALESKADVMSEWYNVSRNFDHFT